MTAVDPSTDSVTGSQNRSKRRRWSVGTAALVVLGLLLALVAAAILTGRYQVRPVLSGSMRPGFAVGGVVVTERVPLDSIKVRDVIAFHRPDQPSEMVVHRVVSLKRTGSTVTIKTRGDANDVRDPWTVTLRGDTAYKVIFSVPLLGYPAVWFHSSNGQGELLLLGGLAIAIASVVLWRRERRRPSDPDGDPIAEDDAPTPAGTPTAAVEPTATDDAPARRRHRPSPRNDLAAEREPKLHLADH